MLAVEQLAMLNGTVTVWRSFAAGMILVSKDPRGT